ncbi:MAG: UTP--glucose-1-phosphate uridylyltransferase [Patescibacteria group bacterium]|nr:UTP--glucose-1-phosphate uridylyltransferase [Patescibacteria group bacterium]
MKKITKVVIPAAGFGTRFLPQTKAMPKEMLPVVDKPVIQYVVEEAINSGIKNIVIITGSNKRAIEDHFDEPSEDLVQNLIQGKKYQILEEIKKISQMAEFIYIRQKGPYGNGVPVLTAEPVIENEPFAVLWGDEFIYSNPPRLKQMIDVYEKIGGIIISGVEIKNKEDLNRYGIADLTHIKDNIYKINEIIEKPDPKKAPSNIATHGGYILPPEIFKALKNIKPGKGGEIWLVDAINYLKKQGIPVYAVVIKNGKYYDTGNKFEYLKTVVEMALSHKEINGQFKTFLKSLKI